MEDDQKLKLLNQSEDYLDSYGNQEANAVVKDPGDNNDEENRDQLSSRSKKVFLATLSYITGCGAMALVLLASFFPVVAVNRHIYPYEIAIIFAIYPLMKFLSSTVIGLYLPQVGVNITIWMGLILEGGGLIIFAFLDRILDRNTFVVYCIITRGFQGAGAGLHLTASIACAIAINQDAIGTTIAIIEFAAGIALIISPIIGGVLYQYGGFKAPFLALGCLLVINSFLVIKFPRIHDIRASPPLKTFLKVLTMPRVVILYVTIILQTICVTFLDPTIAIHLRQFHLSSSAIGGLYGIQSLSYMIFCAVAGIIVDKTGKFRWINIYAFIILAVSFQFVGPAPYLKMHQSLTKIVIVFIFIGLAIALSVVSSYPDMAEILTSRKKKWINHENKFMVFSLTSGLANSGLALGQILGLLIGGALALKSDAAFNWTSSVLGFLALGQKLKISYREALE
ncbi:uncharacterized protein TRIADDRAFT_51495 [Trichoplax adhaerens]|uniref:Major facilitator superfamily (MFS) profile domain-containing protein n=1 Tax=Trichoplax adhaerens TaxID=10228 RepID=B3RJD1_TRIAD|nr:hypothetical protein TRIADDRAFT_51495 [Trichoplax adhaerens]EDV29311.1 hypothetical protein TRIADDRAFT_51495 [Trichoplax adhaerens]|eukprot:XP_002108513.1 hypothetical protein TRIADDRAFT_51495 [Trichoplax adhaerens]